MTAGAGDTAGRDTEAVGLLSVYCGLPTPGSTSRALLECEAAQLRQEGVGVYWSWELPEGWEVCVEPQLFGQLYVALYREKLLQGVKIPMWPRPGKGGR